MTEPRVGILLGSASDISKVEPVFTTFERLGITYEAAIVSAHRSPGLLTEYAKSVTERGFLVVIAAAGLSAALPGALSALVDIPVVGLPLGGGPVSGIDALLSMVDMPKGVPVASVGIDSAQNAALLAARILASSDQAVRDRLRQYREEAAASLAHPNKELLDRGIPVWNPEIPKLPKTPEIPER